MHMHILTARVSLSTMDVLLSGPHDVVCEHRRVSESRERKVCLQARQEGVKSKFHRKQSRGWLDLLKSLMAHFSYGELL